MKKWTRIAIAASTLSLVAATAWAGRAQFQGFDVVNVVVNGKVLQSDVPAVNFFGRTVLPVRAVAEVAGMEVQWDEVTSTATLTSRGDSSALVGENAKLKADLAASQAESAKAKADLAVAQAETAKVKSDLQAAQAELQKAKAALGSTVVDSGKSVIKLTDLPITVTSDNGMVLTVNKVTVSSSSLVFNITLKNNGAADGDSMFSSSEVQAGESKLKFLKQDRVFYDNFLSFHPGQKITGDVIFSAVPAGIDQVIWYFSLEAGTDWDKKQLTFQIH